MRIKKAEENGRKMKGKGKLEFGNGTSNKINAERRETKEKISMRSTFILKCHWKGRGIFLFYGLDKKESHFDF